ncbi:MAG: tetratricopeptide repeat protein [Thermonemataceae bacterium]|nr:tetratricopeptide repeat protein [Thermonemataceae bacterium]
MNKQYIGKILYLSFVLFLWIHSFAYSQDIQLAQEYFVQGKYDKAKDIYEKLAKNSQNWRSIHEGYLLTLLNLKDFETAENFLKKQIKRDEENLSYKVDYAFILQRNNKIKEAEREFGKVMGTAKKDKQKTLWVYESLEKYELYELAETMLLESRKQEKNKNIYAYELSQIYVKLGKKKQMIEELVLLYDADDSYAEEIMGILQDELRKEAEQEMLEQYLIDFVQEKPNHKAANELLLWLYIQTKDFNKAFLQAKAIDKRFKKEGAQLFELGKIAFENKDYTASDKILSYFVAQYSNDTFFYIPARRYMIRAKEEIIKNDYPIDKEKVKAIIDAYQELINSQGEAKAVEAIKDMASLYAFYVDDKDKAIMLLNKAMNIAMYDDKFVASCKIALGDIYVLKGEFGEASLLYYQAEKSQKDSPIAYEAKLKNAKLSYYKGEFEFAQSHLDILKNATTREISNDAINLSVFIQDNTGLDSTEAAMKDFAKIDLLIFQNKTENALEDLDKMLQKYPNHSLTDDIYWSKAQIFTKIGKTDKALEMYQLILKDYKFDMLSDDAHFEIARLYEEKIQDKNKAMAMYQEHLTLYPGSIYVAEARKRFRRLRGDKLN